MMANRSSASSRGVNRPSVEAVISAKLLKEARTKKRTRKDIDDEKENTDANLSSPTKSDTDASYQAYGRILARLINFFVLTNSIIDTGIMSEVNDSDNEDSEDNRDDFTLRRKIEDWKMITSKIPGFRDEMVNIAANLVLRNDVCRHLGRGIESVRSDDCAALKDKLPSFLLLDTTVSLVPPISSTGDKSDRGWKHPTTAHLLCPIELDPNTETIDAIKDGAIIVDAEQLPRFLYPQGYTYEPDDMFIDIFRGYLMLRTAKFIFIGPSCAVSEPGFSKGRRGNASLAGVSSITSRMIAYVAVQLRFALTAKSTWSIRDGPFDYQKFYSNILSIFEADPEAAQDIIDHYNYHLWGDKAGKPAACEATDDSEPTTSSKESAFARLIAQRAAKRAHRQDLSS